MDDDMAAGGTSLVGSQPYTGGFKREFLRYAAGSL